MNKLEKLEEQYKKLGEEIQAPKKNEGFVPGWYMYWGNPDESYVIMFIEDVIRFESKRFSWKHIEPVTQELLNQFIPKPKTKYDWSKFPDWATIAVMNSDGTICCADYESANVAITCWRGVGGYVHGWNSSDEYVSYMDGSQWVDSFEERPK